MRQRPVMAERTMGTLVENESELGWWDHVPADGWYRAATTGGTDRFTVELLARGWSQLRLRGWRPGLPRRPRGFR